MNETWGVFFSAKSKKEDEKIEIWKKTPVSAIKEIPLRLLHKSLNHEIQQQLRGKNNKKDNLI